MNDEAQVFREEIFRKFSTDETPFRTHASVRFLLPTGDHDVNLSGLHVRIDPGECFAAAGIRAPDAAALARIRARILAKPAE